MKKLILASVSSSRRELLERLGIQFETCPSNYQEDMGLPLQPKALAVQLSQGKARDVAPKFRHAVILAADSFVVYEGKLLGKPHTLKKAREMLEELSGQAHTFVTGFTLIDIDSQQEVSDAVESKVYIRKLTHEDITNYLQKEDVRQKAGAYSVQGLGSLLIDKIEGNYLNVVGLPLAHIAPYLSKFGIDLL